MVHKGDLQPMLFFSSRLNPLSKILLYTFVLGLKKLQLGHWKKLKIWTLIKNIKVEVNPQYLRRNIYKSL